jgi:quercetin dioxygenase-like cupin family protein
MYTYILVTAILFYILTPGVFLSLPPGQPLWVQALTHGVVYALVHKYVQHGLLGQ